MKRYQVTISHIFLVTKYNSILKYPGICRRILVGVALLLHLLGRKMSKILTHLEHHHRFLCQLFLILNLKFTKKVAKSGIYQKFSEVRKKKKFESWINNVSIKFTI